MNSIERSKIEVEREPAVCEVNAMIDRWNGEPRVFELPDPGRVEAEWLSLPVRADSVKVGCRNDEDR